jgi:UPF0755 protein
VSRAARVTAVILALIAFALGFVGTAAGLEVTQPAVPGSTSVVAFEIKGGDNSQAIATRLHQQGLIRNTQLFWAFARYKHLDAHLVAGTYNLSPGMTMRQLVAKLSSGQPDQAFVDEVQILIPPGLRVTQYPASFVDEHGKPLLAHFNADNFMKIVTTGVLPDGKTKLSDQFWYVPPKGQNVAFALEGYLFPDTYYFNRPDDEVAVIKRLLSALGEQLCPGPKGSPDAYIHDQQQCKAHAATVGPKNTNIFTEMEQKFSTSDDVQALHDTLALGSIVVREAGKNADDILNIADVYYNRFALAQTGYVTPGGDTIVSLDADPTAWYARDTDTPPKDPSQWWKPSQDQARNVDPNNPYNTTNPDHKGLPPGPIAAPAFNVIAAVAAANEPTTSPYYFFFHDCTDHKTYYAKTYAEQQTLEQQHHPC